MSDGMKRRESGADGAPPFWSLVLSGAERASEAAEVVVEVNSVETSKQLFSCAPLVDKAPLFPSSKIASFQNQNRSNAAGRPSLTGPSFLPPVVD